MLGIRVRFRRFLIYRICATNFFQALSTPEKCWLEKIRTHTHTHTHARRRKINIICDPSVSLALQLGRSEITISEILGNYPVYNILYNIMRRTRSTIYYYYWSI